MDPREKLQIQGHRNMSEVELLSLLIGSGTAQKSYKQLALKINRSVLPKWQELRKAEIADLTRIGGIGFAKASVIIAGVELGRRLFDSSLKERVRIVTASDAAKLSAQIATYRTEHLLTIYLNGRYELISTETAAIGTINEVSLSPREILRRAIELNCYGVILAHNHPSGDPQPSSNDIAATVRLHEACKLMGVNLIDHIIVSKNGWSSVPFRT